MSFVEPSTLQVIADSIGIPKLSTDAAKALAPDVEYRIREIVQEALKFRRHSKRSELCTDDISNALRLKNVQPVYGFASGSKDAARFLQAAGHADLWFLEDCEVPFQQVVGRQPPRAPLEVGVLPHWLVVDGVQPAIPENAPLERPHARKRPRRAAAPHAAAAGAPQTAAMADPAPHKTGADDAVDGSIVRAPVKHVLSQELQLYFDKVSDVLLNGSTAAAGNADAAPNGSMLTASAWAGSSSERLERAVLASLSSDPGLSDLVPYMVQLIADGVTSGLRYASRLQRLVAASAALLTNEHLDLTPYVQQLLPAVLTCLVAKRIGEAASADHWAVRDAAARVVSSVCAKLGDPLHNIGPRISKTLLKAFLDRSKPVTTHYGAIMGLAALGHRSVRLMLLPHLANYLAHLQPLLSVQEATGSASATVQEQLRRVEALRCYAALRTAAVSAVYAGIAERLMDHLLMAQKMQQPGQQDGPQPSAAADSSQETKAGAQPPELQQDQAQDGQHGAEQASAAQQLDAAAATAARVFPHVHQPATAVKRPNPQLGPPDRRKGRLPTPHAKILADAWREDANLGAQLQAVADLFGDSVLPWVPFQPAIGLFL